MSAMILAAVRIASQIRDRAPRGGLLACAGNLPSMLDTGSGQESYISDQVQPETSDTSLAKVRRQSKNLLISPSCGGHSLFSPKSRDKVPNDR